MAAGLPTIGTNVGGLPDFLVDGVTGFVCESNNPESVALAIKNVLNSNPDKLRNIHANALRLIVDKFNWDYAAARIKFILESICVF
jgi:glycosyltransferase involved in cell wall biosynthesis